MFSELIIWYLFLGGLGGGAFLVQALTWCLSRRWVPSWAELDAVLSLPLLVISLISIGTGVICLLKDTPRANQALLLISHFTPTPIGVGALALTLLMACDVLLIAMRALRLDVARGADGMSAYGGAILRLEAPCTLHGGRYLHDGCSLRPGSLSSRGGVELDVAAGVATVVQTVGAAIAFVVIVYTGWFLFSMPAVPLWSSPLLPVLFALSSLSSGIAAALLVEAVMAVAASGAGVVTGASVPAMASNGVRTLVKADTIVIVLETVAAAGIFLQLRDNAVAMQSFELLASGSCALAFWGGFVLCGVAAPLAMELLLIGRHARGVAWFIILGALVLIGALCLRYCTIDAGIHLSRFMLSGI